MKQKIRHIFRKLGYEIVRSTPNQIGKNPLADIVKFLHNDHPVIFDVGANVGQSIQKFRAQLPNCTIHSFEPSPTTFETLGQQASKLNDVHLWNHALGSVPGQMTFLENSHSEMSSFLPLSNLGWGSVTKETLVEVKTIDQFCHDENIGRIDVLKSDTQGFDLEVFKGAERLMSTSKVGLVYFEIIFSDMYKNLPPFAQVFDFLINRDFLLVSFYEFFYQNQLASWTDAVFVHKSYLRSGT